MLLLLLLIFLGIAQPFCNSVYISVMIAKPILCDCRAYKNKPHQVKH